MNLDLICDPLFRTPFLVGLIMMGTLCALVFGCAQPTESTVPGTATIGEARMAQHLEQIPEVLGLSPTETNEFHRQLSLRNEELRAWMGGEKGHRLMAL